MCSYMNSSILTHINWNLNVTRILVFAQVLVARQPEGPTVAEMGMQVLSLTMAHHGNASLALGTFAPLALCLSHCYTHHATCCRFVALSCRCTVLP